MDFSLFRLFNRWRLFAILKSALLTIFIFVDNLFDFIKCESFLLGVLCALKHIITVVSLELGLGFGRKYLRFTVWFANLASSDELVRVTIKRHGGCQWLPPCNLCFTRCFRDLEPFRLTFDTALLSCIDIWWRRFTFRSGCHWFQRLLALINVAEIIRYIWLSATNRLLRHIRIVVIRALLVNRASHLRSFLFPIAAVAERFHLRCSCGREHYWSFLRELINLGFEFLL